MLIHLGCLGAYIASPFLGATSLHLRGWLALAIGLGVVAGLTSVWFIANVLRSKDHNSGSAYIFTASAILTAVGWGFGIVGWVEEFRANSELPIIDIGILLVPVGVLLGVAGLAATWAEAKSRDGRRSR